MLSWIHQAQEHGNCEQRLTETLTRLAVVDRERSLLAEGLTRAETHMTELATEKQLLLQDKAVLSSQLEGFQTEGDRP